MISVIIPVYKVEKYLVRCVNSVLNQTYSDLEIILVDDGSPDSCGKICDELQKKDSRIKVIHKKNGGLSSARNEGLLFATGEYIAYVDSDDYIDKTMYEKLMNYMIETDADIVQCGYTHVVENNDGKVVRKTDVFFEEGNLKTQKSILDVFFKIGVIDLVVWNKLYKRKALENVKMVEGRWHEDTMATFDILLNVNSVASISESLYSYVHREDSITGICFNEKHFDSLYASEYIVERSIGAAPDYVDQARGLFCLNCSYLYIKLANSGLDLNTKKKYSTEIRGEFLKMWRCIEKKKCLFKMRKKSLLLIFLYRLFPRGLVFVYNLIGK